MSSASARKELNDLMALIRRKGYKCAPNKGGYVVVLDKKGKKVIDDHGPVKFSSTPGDFRARDLAWARLERAGIVTKDDKPWAPTPKKERDLLLDEGEPTGKQKKQQLDRLRQVTESRSRHERTQSIRGRLEPLLATVGGWSKRGIQAEIADVLYNYTKGSPWQFESIQATRANVVSMRKGGTLADSAATCWEALLDDLEQAPSLRDRWFELVREARGLPPRSIPVIAHRPTMEPEERKIVLAPQVGELNEELERQRGNGRARERYADDEHPVLELHRDGGIRWYADFTIDDLNDLNRSVGFFEGLAVQVGLISGDPEMVETALERVRRLVEKIGEARHRELVKRTEEGGSW